MSPQTLQLDRLLEIPGTPFSVAVSATALLVTVVSRWWTSHGPIGSTPSAPEITRPARAAGAGQRGGGDGTGTGGR